MADGPAPGDLLQGLQTRRLHDETTEIIVLFRLNLYPFIPEPAS